MSDASTHSECYLTKLSRMPGLNWFKHVVLLSSSQDNYVPFESARLEVNAQYPDTGL
jgi:hypothetical protein